MTWVQLKLNVMHGMSSNSTAYVVHDIQPDRTKVIYYFVRGEYRVEYRIGFYCGKKFKQPLLFNRRNIPPGTIFCKACWKAQHDPLYWDKIGQMNKAQQWKKSHGC